MACASTTTKEKSSEGDSLELLVKDYLTRKHKWDKFPDMGEATAQEWHEVYLSSLDDITDFICGERNTEKVPDGIKYRLNSHQWSMGFPNRQHVVNEMGKSLKDIDAQCFEDFEQLIDFVEEKKITGFGDTSIYDFALRYGWNQNPRILPRDYVYLHSKPREAARHLVDHGYLKKINKLKRKMKLEDYQELLLPGMTASDIEHFLCCYHNQIKQLKQQKK